jgi:hypothetical protein
MVAYLVENLQADGPGASENRRVIIAIDVLEPLIVPEVAGSCKGLRKVFPDEDHFGPVCLASRAFRQRRRFYMKEGIADKANVVIIVTDSVIIIDKIILLPFII